MLTLSWLWWTTRYKVSQGGVFILDKVVFLIRDLVRSFTDYLKLKQPKQKSCSFLSYAEATRGRFPKIDVDGSFSKQCGNDGWGLLLEIVMSI
jgi:hypothetical protein